MNTDNRDDDNTTPTSPTQPAAGDDSRAGPLLDEIFTWGSSEGGVSVDGTDGEGEKGEKPAAQKAG